jgi:GT2 family glycosyltransferase
MCVRAEAIKQVGLLDEEYHMYVEEVDWNRRILAAGWRAYCVPQAKITHFGGQSTGQVKVSSFLNLWRSRYRFYHKTYSPLKVWLASQIVRWGMQRTIQQDRKRAAQGELGEKELLQRIRGYQQVVKIWQGHDRPPSNEKI